jgi:MoaA/NifB/PqqE/SkfB family radical SAM enzyme
MTESCCVLTWVKIKVDPDGAIKPCCISHDYIKKEDGTKFNLGYDSVDDIYNSKEYVELRQKMLDNEYIPGCDVCYHNEKTGRQSRRLINNEQYKETIPTSSESNLKIKFFDLRFGNLCNLKCRMCSPANSNQIAKEITEINNKEYSKFYPVFDIDTDEWWETDTFDDNIKSQVDNIDTIYMTGGEPTVIEKNFEILRDLIELDKSKHITLIINTNLTNTNPRFYQYLPNFKSVILQLSIDGYEKVQEYLRYPSKFKQIDESIHKLIKIHNVKLWATPVIQIGNLNTIVDLFKYFEDINIKENKPLIDIRPILLQDPQHLNIDYLPKDFKQKAFAKIFMWMLNDCKWQSQIFKDTINALKVKCQEESKDINMLQEYIKFNNILDEHRGQTLIDCNEELHTLLMNN